MFIRKIIYVSMFLFLSVPLLAQADSGIGQLLAGHLSAQPQSGNICGRSSECLTNESCINGICQSNIGGTQCYGDYQCPYLEHCINGACKN